jgi:energy-coupling factor transporter ATP-binding protein EcfA2
VNGRMSTPTDQDTNHQEPEANDTNSSTRERSLLGVCELSTGYGETQVLWDISLRVMRGEIVALVGANGAGKSTLLTAISGLLPNWKGTIEFAGRDITHARAERIVKLGLAQVPQGRRLFEVMTFIRTIFPANAWKAESRAIITGLVAPLDKEKCSARCSPEPTTKHPDHRIPISMFLAGISLRKNVMTPRSILMPSLR